MTLISLANVTDSLGGKAVLWELFSLNPPSMELCVRLCAGSPYLASILTSNPGMIDELMDSLMLDSLPSYDQMANSLAELCRGAVDIAPILHSFKNSMHLRVGVRNILGKDTIARTHTALSDIAEACMEQAIHHEFHRLVHQIGMPVCVDEAGVEEPAELVVLAVGKLGGREPNYHSDLDVIFLYEGRGATKSLVPNRRFESTTNRHFFNQLCQRVIHAVTRVGSTGRLYELDVRLRPLGRSGELAITVDDLRRYFEEGAGRVWERQALCKARPIWGSPRAQAAAMNCVHDVLTQHAWTPQLTEQVLQHRLDLQGGASVENMKRGAGGTMDVEFSVQLLQLIHAQEHPETLVPGTLEALDRLQAAGIVPTELAETLHSDYQFLRMVESSIRLMNMSARHELPTETAELQRLAYLLAPPGACPSPSEALALADRVHSVRRRCRHALQQIFSAALPPESSVNIA
jgi:glutamate-ammonia-ligase adenylyltransferase